MHISVTAEWIQLKFGIGGALSRGVFRSKMVNFHLGTIELRMYENSVFLVPEKYTLVCHTSALAVHDTVMCPDTTQYTT